MSYEVYLDIQVYAKKSLFYLETLEKVLQGRACLTQTLSV